MKPIDHTIDVNVEELIDELARMEEEFDPESKGIRSLKKSVEMKEESIMALEEPYPTDCYNHGQLSKQTQKYYMCKSLKPGSTSEAFRVTSETYQRVLSDYPDQYSCYTQLVEKNVCVCPKGVVDYMCLTETYTKCYINITEPMFYKGCEEREDTFEYLYSVPGFSPCYPQFFNESLTIEYELTCQQINENGLVSVAKEQTGYPYRDVVKEATFNPFTYVSSDSEAEFAQGTSDVSI